MTVRVRIPTPLRSYTSEAGEVEAEGSSIDELLTDLDRRFPGIRFRMVDEQGNLRPHMSIFVDSERRRDLRDSLVGIDEVVIMQALSGG